MDRETRLKQQVQHDIERGWLEELRPGVYKATELGVEHHKLVACVSLLTALTSSAQKLIDMLNEQPPGPITFEDLLEREEQPGRYVGQYL